MRNSSQAYVEEKKIEGYLLNDLHPQGQSKSRFFRAFGFKSEHWENFAAVLCRQGQAGEVIDIAVLPESIQYVVEGELISPDGRNPRIRIVWETRGTDLRPRLITAYPAH